MINRRKFLHRTLTASAGVALANLLSSWNAASTDHLSFDLHAHPGLFFAKGNPIYPGDAAVAKTITEMNAGKLTGAFFSLVADAPNIDITPTGVKPVRTYAVGEAWKEYQRQLTILKEIIKNQSATFAIKAKDLDTAFKNKKVAAYIAIEGGDFLDGKAELLDKMYEDGVRSVQLVHYAPNALGDLQTEPPQHNGLSSSGKEVITRMNKLGMVIDVAHASFKTVQDVAALTTSPIILSHSILKLTEERPISVRAITTEHAKLIAQTGGVIGAWPSGFNKSFDEFVDNTKRLVDVAGIDHVGLGTDMDGNFRPVFSSYLQLQEWASGLKSKGFSENEVGKIMGGNVKRVLGKVLG